MAEPHPEQIAPGCDIINTKVRCPGCERLLFVARHCVFFGGVTIEIKCPRCGAIVVWPVAAAEVKTGSNEDKAQKGAET
jgi:ribosomal protein S27E